ncbi:MAG: serine hydrolase domain-containing protein [Chloroflexia bacterium]
MDGVEIGLERLVEAGLPGAFVYVEDADGASRFYTAGYADVESGRLMTPGTHYRIGSTTKTFTAVVTMQLVREGKLALGDSMRAVLPDMSIPNGEALTVEHLLRMRSGLFDFEDDPSLLGDLEAHLRPTTLQHAVDMGIRQPAMFAPGEKFAYCNTNFCVLEMVIERVTGRSLAAEFEERIFGPLGLVNTSYPDEYDLSLPEPYVRGYERTEVGWRECSEVFFGRGDGAIISTAIDVGRFFRALLVEGRLLTPEMLGRMMSVVEDEPPAEMAYGLGLIADEMPCGTVWGHSGGGLGYGHAPYLRLETGRFAIFMRNASLGFRLATDPELAERLRFSPEFRAGVYC